MTDRDKILDRIRKLRSLSEDRGATPDEAAAAAAKIRQIIADYGLDQVDLEAVDITVDEVDLGRSRRQAVDDLVSLVAYATGCVAVFHYRRRGLGAVYVGADPAPEIATYLHSVCYRAIEAAATDFRRSDEYRRRRKPSTRAAAVRAFKHGMITRLGSKLVALGWMTGQQRDRLYLAYERQEGTKLVQASEMKAPSQTQRYADARQAGDAAGRAVDIYRPVGGGSDVKLIGSI